jgi:hypothetical protein
MNLKQTKMNQIVNVFRLVFLFISKLNKKEIMFLLWQNDKK